MAVMALVSELMMQSQLSGAARRAGVDLSVYSSEDALLAEAESRSPQLVIVDLSHPGLDAAALLEKLRPKVGTALTLAFGPHVHRQQLDAATAAGYSSVLTRGQFHANMLMILASMEQEPPSSPQSIG